MSWLAQHPEAWDVVFKESKGRFSFVRGKLKRPPARILDVGCATGSFCRVLVKEGYEVDGLDINRCFVDTAQKKVPQGRFHVGDMRLFNLDRRFDAVLCLGTTLAYSQSNSDVLRSLRCFHRHLKRGGVVVVDVLNAISMIHPGGFKPVTRHSFLINNSRYEASIQHRLLRESQRITEMVSWRRAGVVISRGKEESQRLFFPQELKAFLDAAGFSRVKLFDGYQGRNADFSGRRLVAIASKGRQWA